MADKPTRRVDVLIAEVRSLMAALPQGEKAVVEAVEELSTSRRWLAPLALTLGGFAMLFDGLRLLFSNWRLIVIQLLPAMWVWLAMYDLRARVLRRTPKFHPDASQLVPIAIVIIAITALGFFLNAVFAFSIAGPPPPDISGGFAGARKQARPVLIAGAVVGAALAVATLLAVDWPRPWGTLTLGIVVAVLMICYVAVPARALGVKKSYKQQEKWTVTLVGSGVGFLVEAPAYLLGRLGILLLGVPGISIVGAVMVAVGIVLQIGATGAVRAVKLGSVLLASTPAEKAAEAKLKA